MFAARRASISSALARADSSASAALAIGSYVRSCVALDLSFHVVTVTDWCLLTDRMEGMLLLCSGEHYIVVKPTAEQSDGDAEAVIWLKGAGVACVGRDK
jgi:hypothetical protein